MYDGGLLPGYFDSVTVFIVFAGCALFSALVLLPHALVRLVVEATSSG